MSLSPKVIRVLAGLGAVALALVVVVVLGLRGGDDDGRATTTARVTSGAVSTGGAPAASAPKPSEVAPKPSGAAPKPSEASSPTRAPGVPANAYDTLREIDAGRWPDSANAPGTKGGDPWMNRAGTLAAEDAAGKSITYREWDVNPKQRGRSRDAERIVTGSDGSAWYTGDHYETFTRMR
ncbi:guanyl-specific ribonuclease Sa [Nocardia tenerifensis]|uniref:Guanyl-specific ribonuclease Sa n=1 Tax=Nocardia tenerifensis TaxID=228006 RepID=A0A318KSI5_9NOCA|nr:ribonuclease domain-containing protein [Nocardia tenerifensis]PXX66437.1 guanyl-specific ribonuclease Sa [Nocardia tenerifensis]